MSDTLVLQSHRKTLPFPWLQSCLDSVSHWAESNHYDFQFMGDELFALVPAALLKKTAQQVVIATDLARLLVLQAALRRGYETVIWCDADFLIFDPDRFALPDATYALGREVWVQADSNSGLRVYTKVHNAFLMFRRGNSFLDFYAETAARLLRLNTGRMPSQFIGPKLLTALHNIVVCPVAESAGVLSPPVMKDLIQGGGAALDLFREKSVEPICAANLSSSLTVKESISDAGMSRLIAVLHESGVG